MIDRAGFYAEFGIDPETAGRALAVDAADPESSTPWYVRLVTAIGAWFTAAAATALGIALVLVVLEIEFDGTLAALGIVYLAAGVSLLRALGTRPFAAQLGIGLAAAGLALIAAGVWAGTGDLWQTTLTACVASAVTVLATAERTLQFLAALLCAVLFCLTLIDFRPAYALDVAALAGPAGLLLMLYPPRRSLRPVAIVLLTLFPAFAILATETAFSAPETTWPTGWLARALNIGLFLWLVAGEIGSSTDTTVRAVWIAMAVVAVAIGLLLPPGSSAALVVLMLALVLGSRPLALLGIVLESVFVWRFYYDLTLSLLAKSGLLVAVGVILLLAWWLVERQRTSRIETP